MTRSGMCPHHPLAAHVGAVRADLDQGDDILKENLRRFLAGEELYNMVVKERGY